MPSDVEHKSSRATKQQRERFGRASKKWASIPGPIKADLRQKYGFVDAQTPHGLSGIKVLQGAHLFTSQEVHLQKYHQTHQQIPFYLCFILTDELGNPLDLKAHLGYYVLGIERTIPGYYLCTGNTLFYPVPKDADPYKLGYTTMGTFGYQIFTYHFPELLKVEYRWVAPNVEAHYGAPWIMATHPPAFDWEASKSPGPPNLWAYHVHQPTGVEWNECYSWRAFTLTWRKITPDTFSITISLGYLVRDDIVKLRPPPGFPTIWKIIGDGLGSYHTEPAQHTCIYRIAPWQILSYHD